MPLLLGALAVLALFALASGVGALLRARREADEVALAEAERWWRDAFETVTWNGTGEALVSVAIVRSRGDDVEVDES